MKWTRGTRNDDVVDVRGRRSTAARVGGGGIIAVLAVVVAARLFGVDISGLFSGGGGGGGAGGAGAGAPAEPAPPSGPDPEAEQIDFIRFVMKDIQDTFEGLYRQAGRPYRRAQLLVFRQAIDTRCGRSSSAIGPFYCPGDDRLQKQAGVEVDPETFTHGTSEQRVRWFRRGFDAGRLEACDTFSGGEP